MSVSFAQIKPLATRGVPMLTWYKQSCVHLVSIVSEFAVLKRDQLQLKYNVTLKIRIGRYQMSYPSNSLL